MDTLEGNVGAYFQCMTDKMFRNLDIEDLDSVWKACRPLIESEIDSDLTVVASLEQAHLFTVGSVFVKKSSSHNRAARLCCADGCATSEALRLGDLNDLILPKRINSALTSSEIASQLSGQFGSTVVKHHLAGYNHHYKKEIMLTFHTLTKQCVQLPTLSAKERFHLQDLQGFLYDRMLMVQQSCTAQEVVVTSRGGARLVGSDHGLEWRQSGPVPLAYKLLEVRLDPADGTVSSVHPCRPSRWDDMIARG